jgi:hypothetical protein
MEGNRINVSYFNWFHCRPRPIPSLIILSLWTLQCVQPTDWRIMQQGRPFAEPRLQLKSNAFYIFWVRICSRNYSACNAHAPYCHLRPTWLCHNFPHYLVNGMIFGRKLLNTICVFWFSLQLLSETFLIPRRIQRDIIINVHTTSCKVPIFLVGF